MAASSELPPLPPIDPPGPLFLGFDEPPPQPAFTMTTVNDLPPAPLDSSSAEASPRLPTPPPPAPADLQQAVDGAAENGEQPSHAHARRDSQSSSEAASDGSDEEEEDERSAARHAWRPIAEDMTQPCEDELAYISDNKKEHSATDHAYWQTKTFFDLEDPEITTTQTSRIDWLVEHYNGTKDEPNLELIMRSPTVSIGGYDWCIKFYPKGNNSEFLSVYLECATMQAPEFEEMSDDLSPALPFLTSMVASERPQKRRTVAAQLSIVMYNPEEPRTYEHKVDAHQFTKRSADYGWTHFTHEPRQSFHCRQHLQRQAILHNDKLAFTAHVRVLDDPTGCMWAHGTNAYEDSLALTSLRPFSPQCPMFAAELPLLHFAPFRDFIYRCSPDGKIVFFLQTLLWKMLSRRRSRHYGQSGLSCPNSDSIAWLRHAAHWLGGETDPGIVNDLIGSFSPESGAAVGANKLKTKNIPSVQAAIDAHPTPIEKPALLTLELERAEFDRSRRRWDKITNKVDIPNNIVISGTSYTLFAFSTHCGELTSNKFNVYIRPNGSDSGWYAYTSGSVTRLTHKQAVEKHSGYDEPTSPQKHHHRSTSRLDPACRGIRRHEDLDEVAHVLHYVREDCKFSAFARPFEETWSPSEAVRKGKLHKQDEQQIEPPLTATNERFPVSDVDVEAEELVRKNSFSSSEGAETPNCWVMDGEDVVMSDAMDDSSSQHDEEEDAAVITDAQHFATYDHLGKDHYKGQMLANKYHGEGHLIAMNGDEYIGSFHLNEKSGHGTITYANTGNIYAGQWLEDQHHGKGILTEAKTGNVYEGSWKHGRKSGPFVLKGTVTEDDKGCCSICYDREISTAFYDCGHVVACRDCAARIESCPVCRKRVLARLELFGVKMSIE